MSSQSGIRFETGLYCPRWAYSTATLLGLGRVRPGPGTWASLLTVLVWSGLAYAVPEPIRTFVAIAVALAVSIIGTAAATKLETACGITDPSMIVIDEVAGQMFALIACPLDWKWLIAAFILFRAFDILKPPPARQLEKMHGGLGIMMDDIAAGLYSLAVLQIALHYGLMS